MALASSYSGTQNILLGNVFFPQTFQQRSMMTPEQVVTNFHLFPMQKFSSMFLDSAYSSTSSYSSSNTSQSPKNDRSKTSPNGKPSSDDGNSSRSGSSGPEGLKFSIASILGSDGKDDKSSNSSKKRSHQSNSTESEIDKSRTSKAIALPLPVSISDFNIHTHDISRPPQLEPNQHLSQIPVIEGQQFSLLTHWSDHHTLRRTVFTQEQRKALEESFQIQKYISKPNRLILARRLGLKDSQVKIWFQNRSFMQRAPGQSWDIILVQKCQTIGFRLRLTKKNEVEKCCKAAANKDLSKDEQITCSKPWLSQKTRALHKAGNDETNVDN